MLYSFWPAGNSPALKSVNPDRPGGPIQSKCHHIAVRNPAAWEAWHAVRMVERKLIKLVTEKAVKLASKRPVQPHPRIAVGVSICIGARTSGQVVRIGLTRQHACLGLG